MGKTLKGLAALSPLAVFVIIYIASSLAAGDFYAVPVSSAFLVSTAWAIAVSKGSLRDRLAVLGKGSGNPTVMTMIWIFILAGAFAGTAKEIGAVEATVEFTLRVLPDRFALAGLFIASCFISMSIGTSVGTIAALVPVGVGVAAHTGMDTALVTGVVAGGAFFGDNLSFISDTTIAATQTQGCQMKDKFRSNFRIALPAALAVTAWYIYIGMGSAPAQQHHEIDCLRLIPYLSVIVLALCGVDVMAVLTAGIGLCCIIGLATGSFGWTGMLSSMGSGVGAMGDLIAVTLLAGGMLELIRRSGGMDFIIEGLTRRIRGKIGAELAIAALVSIANVCTANNTIAIITCGPIAADITRRFGLDPRRSASLLDTFSCLVQGLLPYGAQMLMAAGLACVSPMAVIAHLHYPMALGVCALGGIFLHRRHTT